MLNRPVYENNTGVNKGQRKLRVFKSNVIHGRETWIVGGDITRTGLKL
jgi:hypothetical protein